MNQESSSNEPPSKRFKAESNGQINEIRTASPINGLSFNGNIGRIASVSQINVANNARFLLANSRATHLQNILPGNVLHQALTQQGNLVRLQSPSRNVATLQRVSTPNATHIQRQTPPTTFTPTSGIQVRIPIQSQQYRNSTALIQPGISTVSNQVIRHQPILVQQSQGRPVFVFQNQVLACKQQQNSVVDQGVGTILIPQSSSRSQSTINLPQNIHHTNQVLVQKAQIQHANQQPASQLSIQDVVANRQAQNAQNTSIQSSTCSLAQKQKEEAKRKIQHMCMLLHARYCKAQENGTTCPHEVCPRVKSIYRHMINCNLGRNCKEFQCVPSKYLITHWDVCNREECILCKTIHSKFPNYQKLRVASTNNSNTTKVNESAGVKPPVQHQLASQLVSTVNHSEVLVVPPSVLQENSSMPKEEANTDWRKEITPECRTYLLKELVSAVFPVNNTEDLKRPTLSEVVANAKIVENQLYNSSSSKEQYYQNLAERIYRIQNDLEKFRDLKNSGAEANENSNRTSPAQKLEDILNKKKVELSSSGPATVHPREVILTTGGISSVTQEQKVKEEIETKKESEMKVESGTKTEPKEEVHEHKIPVKKKEWTRFELHKHLNPILEKLYRLDPDSMHFRQPVDPYTQNIPEYLDIIKNPMDLSTIKRKLDTGVYTEPWEFIDDMWLMFENAWLFNRKSSRVYKSCTKLAEVFEPEINAVMKAMGFCCGKKYVFYPQVLCCYGKPTCTIQVHASYNVYQNKCVYCDHCFNDARGDEIEFSEDPDQPSVFIKKDLFTKEKNSEMVSETFAMCTHCGRKQHQICSMYHEPIYPDNFICNHCIKFPGIKRPENKFTAKNLLKTCLSTNLENRVNAFLRDNKSGAGMVTVRVHSIVSKTVEVKPEMKNRFCTPESGGSMNDNLPYTAKAIFAYQEVDGVDVCFFGMHVQEYGSDCPAPNTRRVYIAYLDSVNFFQPGVFKTSVYHEIIIGYLDYVKNLGFTTAHIWACPPSEGDDYIFHIHPPDMKIPKPKRLADWYKKMLDKAIIERVVIDYKDIIKDALENGMQTVTELPYFEGDFWPNIIETCITELDQEHQRRREFSDEFDDHDSSNVDYECNNVVEPVPGSKRNHKGTAANKKRTAPKKSGLNKKNYSKAGQAYPGNDLMSKLFVMMEKHREVFFVVRLKNYHESHGKLPPIKDPDASISSDLMDGRDSFLMFCRENHYEFSSIRRAKHSSMVMLHKLHTQFRDNVYLCNNCRKNVEGHYHCFTCEDFDLCITCYEENGHEHVMEKQGLEFVDVGSTAKVLSTSSNNGVTTTAVSKPQSLLDKKKAFDNYLLCLRHALQCHHKPISTSMGLAPATESCQKFNCVKVKVMLEHFKGCKNLDGCNRCRQFNQLLMTHARECTDKTCLIPGCQAYRQDSYKRRHQRDQMHNRRVASMQGALPGNLNNGTNQRSAIGMQRPPVRTPATPSGSVASQPLSASQARVPLQGQTSNVRYTIPAIKVQGNSVMSSNSEATPNDVIINLNPDLIKKLLSSNPGKLSLQESQVLAFIRNNPQVQAIIQKKQQDRSHSNSPVVEERQNIVITPSNSNAATTLATTPQHQQVRQHQIVITPNSNVGQRNTMIGFTNNRSVMLSQSTPNINPRSSNMPDSNLTLQDQLSRYADQL